MPSYRRALAGKRIAYTKCATCGHTRVRHGGRGLGVCTMTAPVIGQRQPALFPDISAPCPCQQFRPIESDKPCPTNVTRGTQLPLW